MLWCAEAWRILHGAGATLLYLPEAYWYNSSDVCSQHSWTSSRDDGSWVQSWCNYRFDKL